MTNEDIIDNRHSYFPFEVIAVHKNASQNQQNTKNSSPQPVNVKIKIRNRDEMVKGEHRFISMPKFNGNSWPKKMRLVSSDQTIISFKLVMEPGKDESGKKCHKGLLKIFKPGGCLSINNSEDEYSYIPSTSNELNRNSEPGMEDLKNNTMNENFSLKKNIFSPSYTNTYKTPKQFMGKCKPGGCLDPPFGEDNYVYKPTIEDDLILEQTLQKTEVNKAPLDPNKESTKVKLKNQTLEQRTGSLHQSQTDLETEPEDTESLVTYPLSLSSSYSKNRDSQSRKSKSGINSDQLESSRQLTNEFPISFFMPPRKEKPKQKKSYDDYNKRESKVKEAYINNEYIVQSQTPSEMLSEAFIITSPSLEEPLKDAIQEKEMDIKLELLLRNNKVSRESVKSKDLFISDINDITRDEKIFLKQKISESPSEVSSVIEEKNIVSKITDNNRAIYNNIDTLKKSVEMDNIKKIKVDSLINEDKITGPEIKSQNSLSILKLSREKLTIATINESNSLLNHSDNTNITEVGLKRETGSQNGIRNILEPIQKEGIEKQILQDDASKDSSVTNSVTNNIINKIDESNLRPSQKELKKKSINELNGLLNRSENKNIADIGVKEKTQITTNNILDSIQSPRVQESLKYESPKDSSSTVTTDISIKVRTSNLKSNQEELTKESIDESTGPLNHPGNEYIADSVVKTESGSQSRINNILEPIQKEVFEKQILKYDASRDSSVTNSAKNNVAIKVDETNLKSSQEESINNSIGKLNDDSENIDITGLDVKGETGLRIGTDNILDPFQNEITEQDTFKDERHTSDTSIKFDSKNEKDNITNLQNGSLDGNKNIEESYIKEVKNVNDSILLSTEKNMLSSETKNHENNIKRIENNSIVSEFSIKPVLTLLDDTEAPESIDLNLKKPNIKISKSKSTISENSLNINIIDGLINTSSIHTELQPHKTDSKTISDFHEEIQNITTDKDNILNSNETKQEILDVLQSDSLKANESILLKESLSPQISKSKIAQNEVFQDKNTFNQSSYKENKDTFESNSGSILHILKSQSLDNAGFDTKKHISVDAGLQDEADNWTTNETISIKSMKKDSKRNINLIIKEDIKRNYIRLSSLSQNMEDKYSKNDINKGNLYIPEKDIENITKTDTEPLEKGNHEQISSKSINIIKDLNKTPLSSSSIDHKKRITSISSVAINFAFRSSTNEFGYTIETLDPSTNLAAYEQDKITTVRTTLRNDASDIKVMIDSETDITIHLKRHSKHFEGSKSDSSNGRDNIIREYCSETSINKDQLLKNSLKTVYETLVPIEKILANLKEEANALYQDQLLLKKILSSMEVKPKRIIRTNKTCSCLKEEIGMN